MQKKSDNARIPENADSRREFLKGCGRFAAVMPPAITLLLSTSLTSNAIASSGGSGSGGGGTGGGGGWGGSGGGAGDSGPKSGGDTGVRRAGGDRRRVKTDS